MSLQIPIEIKGYPMPPSINSIYGTNKYTGKRYKSQKYQKYEQEVARWARMNAYQLDPVRRIVERMRPNWVFHVEHNFYHRPDRIMSKEGHPRKNDTTNRFKALDDTLSKLIGLDDSYFWCGKYDKHPSIHPALGEYVDIKITVMQLDPPPKEID